MSNFTNFYGNLTAIVGGQWGDEGKGKLIDILSAEYDIVARATGGANAGHTIYVSGEKFIFHLVPSGMLHEDKICVIGNGVVLHLPTFFEEIETLESHGIKTSDRIFISDRAHVLLEYHKIIDRLQEEMKKGKKVGTTGRGIGPAYTDKIRRNGIRVHELLNFEKFTEKYQENLAILKKMYGDFEYDAENELKNLKELTEKLKPMIRETEYFLNEELAKGKNILVEGANGALLDIDHGTYPFVTSSNASIGGVVSGTGLGATKFKSVVGIMKAYMTRVGAGPFPTELTDTLGDEIREKGGEYGSTTGRPRRCGWFDAVASKYSVMLNNLSSINLTKLDVLTGLPSLKIATSYKYNNQIFSTFPADLEILEHLEPQYIELPGWTEDLSQAKTYEQLPQNARNYIEKIEELIGCKSSAIGIGYNRHEMIFRP